MLIKPNRWNTQSIQPLYSKRYVHICILVCLLITISSYSQSDNITTRAIIKRNDSILRQRDIKDEFRLLLRLKPAPIVDSSKLKTHNLHLAISPFVSYVLNEGGYISAAFNASFYTSDSANTHFSTITLNGPYSLERQLITSLISNIWTKNSAYDFLGDWRYFNYPTFTYGLGSNSSLSRRDSIDYRYIKFHQEVLRHFNSFYYLGVGYYYDKFYDIVDNENATDFQQYNQYATQTISSGLVAHFMYDNRANIKNPGKGFYASIIYVNNSKQLGSDQNWQSLQLEVRKYFRLIHHNILAFWAWNEVTFGGKPPYLELPSTGSNTYSTSGRGYVPGRFTGTNMGYFEGEYRFAITRNGLLGGVVFANAETQSQLLAFRFPSIIPAKGVGLRIKFNKYSNVNLCFDYAVGIDGPGFFFNLGEVF